MSRCDRSVPPQSSRMRNHSSQVLPLPFGSRRRPCRAPRHAAGASWRCGVGRRRTARRSWSCVRAWRACEPSAWSSCASSRPIQLGTHAPGRSTRRTTMPQPRGRAPLPPQAGGVSAGAEVRRGESPWGSMVARPGGPARPRGATVCGRFSAPRTTTRRSPPGSEAQRDARFVHGSMLVSECRPVNASRGVRGQVAPRRTPPDDLRSRAPTSPHLHSTHGRGGGGSGTDRSAGARSSAADADA